MLATAAAAHLVLLVPGPWWTLAVLKTLVALSFPLVLWHAGFFTPYEQEEVRRTVRKLLGSRDVGASEGP